MGRSLSYFDTYHYYNSDYFIFQTESPVFPSTTTSVSMQSPIQSSLSSPSQDHGYCSNTNDRQVLEKNLEKLISERGMDVIGQLTKEMSPQQIERLLVQTKQKLQGTNSVPLLQPALAVTPTEAGLQKRVVQPDLSLSQQQQQSRPRKSTKGLSSSHSRGSMNDVQYNKHVDTSDEEDVADLSNSGRPKPGGLITKQRSNSTKDSNLAHGSAKNLSVRFDPNQVQTSPHMEHQMVNVQQGGPQQPPNSSRPPRGHGGGHHRSHHGHHKSSHGGGHSGDPGSSRHRSRRAMSRQPERAGYHYHQPLIPRSHSYSGQAGLQESLAQMGQVPPQMLTRHQSPHVGRRPPPPIHGNYVPHGGSNYGNYHPQQGFVVQEEAIIDNDDACSTCSSSSSDSDDPYAYQLPTRKAYGGVRLSYVPNDRIRAGRHQHQRSMSNQNGNGPSGNPNGNGNPASEYVSQRHSLRGASLQPASLPPRQQQQQQPQHQQAHQHQQQQQQQHHQHHQHQQLQQQFHQPSPQSQNHHFAHPGPASGTSSAGSKDKDKCIIS